MQDLGGSETKFEGNQLSSKTKELLEQTSPEGIAGVVKTTQEEPAAAVRAVIGTGGEPLDDDGDSDSEPVNSTSFELVCII